VYGWGGEVLSSPLAKYSRFELKYLIPPHVCDEVRRLIEPFMQPDPHAARCPNFVYPVCSLYLDSPDLLLYNEVLAGEKNRFKLRVRSYSDDPAEPVFMEVKGRVDRILHKRRARVDPRMARQLLASSWQSYPVGVPGHTLRNLDYFTNQRALISAKPAMRVRYMREAYESQDHDPVRLTFDTHLRHAVTLEPDFSMKKGPWIETPVDGVILEIKFTELFPDWLIPITQLFQLQAQSVPKYVLSVTRALGGARPRLNALAQPNYPDWHRKLQRYDDAEM